jgi:hypothetical protein
LPWQQRHESIHLTSLDPVDLSAAIAQGRTLSEIAQQVGKSQAWVQKALTIASRLAKEAKSILQSAEQWPALAAVYAIAEALAEAQPELAWRGSFAKLMERPSRPASHKTSSEGGPCSQDQIGRRIGNSPSCWMR